MSASTGLFRGDVFIDIERGSKIVWKVDTAGLSSALYEDRLQNLEQSDLWRTYLTSVDPDVTIDSTTPGLYIISVSGSSGVSATALRDSLNALMTVGPRRMTETLLNPGTNKQVLQTVSGSAQWVTDPELPDRVAQYFYSNAIEAQNSADTSGNKHVLYISQLGREYPVAYGTSYSSMQAHIYLRTSTLHRSYTSTLVTVGFPGTGALSAGDKLLLRVFPGFGVSSDKYLRVYRLPEGTNAIGGGSTVIYGEQIGYFVVPAAYFPSTGYVNIDVTLSYKVHQ